SAGCDWIDASSALPPAKTRLRSHVLAPKCVEQTVPSRSAFGGKPGDETIAKAASVLHSDREPGRGGRDRQLTLEQRDGIARDDRDRIAPKSRRGSHQIAAGFPELD